MAIQQKKMLQLLRGKAVATKEDAIKGIETLVKESLGTDTNGANYDGTPIVGRYLVGDGKTKSIFGLIHQEVDDSYGVTFFENIDNLQAEIDRLDKRISATTVYSADKTIVITPSENPEEGTDISVNIDKETIVASVSGVLSADKTLRYVAATEEKGAYITLVNAVGDEEGNPINVSDLIGNGLLEETKYDRNTGILTLTFKNASGGTDDVEVDLHEMLDVNDVMVESASTNYLKVELDGEESESGKSQAVFSALISKMEDTSYEEDNVKTGLVDAADVKKYIDETATDLAVTAEGDSYIDAYVDDADNKHVIVSAKTEDVKANAGTRGTWTVSDAGEATLGDDEVAPTIEGVEGALMDNAQAVSAIKTYVDAKVDAESARTDAMIEAAVKALDFSGETFEDDVKNYKLTYDVTDGIVDIDFAASGLTPEEDGTYVSSANTVAENLVALDDALAEVSASTLITVNGLEAITASANTSTEDGTVIDIKIDAVLEDHGDYANHKDVAGLVLTPVAEGENGANAKLDVSFDFGTFGE